MMGVDKEAPLLIMEGISKSFPGVRALSNVSIRVQRGTTHALMGENGAGKSTLMKCLFGVYTADSGEIFLDGQKISFKNSRDALSGGVAMVHQELNQANDLSVMDNLWLGRFPRAVKFLPFTSESEMLRRTEELFRELSIDTDPRERVGDLSISRRQMIEIAKAVSYNSRIIVFDEPTSSLDRDEAEKLFEIIERLKARGCGIIYISHKMEEILRISDEVSIMRDGELVATKAAAELTTDEIIRLMVGRELGERYPERKRSVGEPIFEAEHLSGRVPPLRDVSFTLRRGEILGVAGLEGAGRTELLMRIFGLLRGGGEMRLLGKEIKNASPKEAIRNGFAMLTEDRRKNGIFGILPLTSNATVSSIEKYSTAGLISEKKINKATDWCISAMRVKTPGRFARIENLSGGNQQKIILGRWLLTEPKILLLDEPTRGIDVGAKFEIYKLIGDLAERGCGVILVSSEMPELLGLCDRILVLSAGRLSGELAIAEATQERIMEYATRFL